MRRSGVAAIAAFLLLMACGKPAEDQPVEPTALVTTAMARAGALDETVDAYGRVEFDPNALKTLTAPVEARVATLDVAVGQSVVAGQEVATLRASPGALLEANTAERDARAAQTEFERLSRLRADGLAANNEVESARAAAGTAQENARSLRGRTGGGLIVLRAPRSGVVDSLQAATGDLVAAGGPVIKLGGAGPMRARLGIEPQTAVRMAPGQPVRLGPVSGAGAVYLQYVQSVDRRVDAATRLAGVLVTLPSATGFLPGQAVKGQIVIGRASGGVIVPRAAVLYEGDAPYVFLAVAGKAVRRDVRLGADDGVSRVISSGVKPGERVVVEGGAVLEDGMKLREARVSHAAATP